MNPINALHIIDALPKRLYSHDEWGTLEYSTVLLSPDPEKGRRVMIGICHNEFENVRVATYVLYEDGSMYMYDAENDRKLPYGIRYAHLQMLLSEHGLHGWIINDKNTRGELSRAVGSTLEEPAVAHQPLLLETMEQVRNAYAQIV